MNEDDKFYYAETLVYNTMRLIDDEALIPFSEMKECVDNLDAALDYEWKGFEDPFFQERRNILTLGISRKYSNGPIDEFKLGGHAFCINCGSAIAEGGGCECHWFCCDKCGEIYDECTCFGIGYDKYHDYCNNCGRARCSCCGPGCTYDGGKEHYGLNHLPCCYNADEYGTCFWENTLWRGSTRCRDRPKTKARKGV
jgi:hypothetical protein